MNVVVNRLSNGQGAFGFYERAVRFHVTPPVTPRRHWRCAVSCYQTSINCKSWESVTRVTALCLTNYHRGSIHTAMATSGQAVALAGRYEKPASLPNPSLVHFHR